MWRAMNRVALLLASISCVSLLVFAEIASAADAAPANAAPAKAATDSANALPEFPLTHVWIILGIIALMAWLFWYLFKWQQRIEQSGYFGKIFQDTIEGIETDRLTAPIRKNWAEGRYLDEIFLRRSPRGVEWVTQNAPPPPPDGILELASQLGCEYEIYDIQRAMEISPSPYEAPVGDGGGRNPFAGRWGGMARRPGSAAGELGGSGSGIPHTISPTEEELRKKRQKYEQLLHEFGAKARDWTARATTRAWGWYQEEVAEMKEEAQAQATQALKVDFSALRGRGPEFVLEFTALIVIIFAAAILGIVKILPGDQIGTLLAAIAGYVLGKSTTRSQPGSGEEKPGGKTSHANQRAETKNQGGDQSKAGAPGEKAKS